MLLNNVCLEGIAYELPPYVMTTDAIFDQLNPMLERLKIPIEGVVNASGVEERRYWAPNTSIVEASTRAARKVLEKTGVSPADIGCIVSTSVCKDYIEPSMASIVHGELGLRPDCLNFDIGNACLAFMNAVSVVGDMIDQGRMKAALIIDAESAREVVDSTIEYLLGPEITVADFQLHFAALTLGSGAVAAVLTHRSASQTGHKVVGHVSLADTRHRNLCLGNRDCMTVQARPLMEAGVSLAHRTWQRCQEVFGWSDDKIDLYVGHQVGRRHYQVLFEALQLNQANSYVTYPFLGNVGPASVPLTLALAEEAGRLRSGSRVALMGIGSGLNCSMMELIW